MRQYPPSKHMDKETIRLIGRSSRLSLLQIEIVKQKIQTAFPDLNVEIIARKSKGDTLQNIPLHTVEGSDFFTQDIFDALTNDEADIAVHSLKDMSSEHFFGQNKFAVVDRDDVRDVAVFNKNIEEKLRNGETIVIGTCSPRREEMATVFLKKALPFFNKEIQIKIKPIRGNVETRLKKLDAGEYDATILATAGLNRLLRSKQDVVLVRQLLEEKKLMLLPLIECVPAPCQGAIVAEAHHTNKRASEILNKINDARLYVDCVAEKKEAVNHGIGCLQQFGVASLLTRNDNYLYAAGRDAEGKLFEKWQPLPDSTVNTGNLFSSTDMMKEFFEYEWSDEKVTVDRPVVFVANYKALGNCSTELLGDEGGPYTTGRSGTTVDDSSTKAIKQKTILVSGTKTWLELAKKGYWVTASADALGFEFLLPSLKMPLLNISTSDIVILTHEEAAKRWQRKGYLAVNNYKLLPRQNKNVEESITTADVIFWSSYAQFEFYGQFAKPAAKHLCCGGETAALLRQSGITPVIFPTIKAFQQWRNFSIRSHSDA